MKTKSISSLLLQVVQWHFRESESVGAHSLMGQDSGNRTLGLAYTVSPGLLGNITLEHALPTCFCLRAVKQGSELALGALHMTSI